MKVLVKGTEGLSIHGSFETNQNSGLLQGDVCDPFREIEMCLEKSFFSAFSYVPCPLADPLPVRHRASSLHVCFVFFGNRTYEHGTQAHVADH